MKFSLFLLLIILYGCSNSDKQPLPDEKINELRTFVEINLKEIDSTAKLDSFRFLRMDTISQNDYYYGLVNYIYDEMDNNSKIMDLQMEVVKGSARIANLHYDLNKNSYNTYKKEYEDEKQKFIDLQSTNVHLLNIADSFTTIWKMANDSIPVAYLTTNLFQIRYPDQSVKKDTTFIYLNLDKNIIKKKDLYKYE